MSKPVIPTSSVSLPLATRLAIEIPKPKDWQAFQRNCVLLFRDELRDPNAQEYGRTGQDQAGIDILARRGGDKDHFVGVQCRHIQKPLKKAKILSDARDALAIEAKLKELIFATTAPDDTKATNAAIEVERQLNAEGHDIRIVVFGWEHMQKLICLHEVAYNAFHPSAVSRSTPLAAPPAGEFADIVAAKVVEQLRANKLAGPPLETTDEESAEDPPLHAKIDTYRDLFKDRSLPLLTLQQTLRTLLSQDLSSKPWARYRIETILASIELDLGKERDAALRFQFAHSLRPTYPKAIANLALAQTILGEYALAMESAKKAIDAVPPADHALSYLMQAAARSDWVGNPEDLIPAKFRETVHADLGLAEFLRRRELPGWQRRCIAIAARYPSRNEFKLLRATAVLALVVEDPSKPEVDKTLLSDAAEDMLGIANRSLDVGFADAHDLLAHINNAALLLRFTGRHKECEELLVRGIAACGSDPQLRRLLALSRFAQDRTQEAIATIADDTDQENSLLRAEFLSSTGNPKAALLAVLAVPDADMPDRLRKLRWHILGDLSLTLADWTQLDDVVRQLRVFDPFSLAAELLLVRKLRRQTHDRNAVKEALQSLIKRVGDDVDLVTRFEIASEAYNSDLPDAAAALLKNHVDLQHPQPPTFLYLESLAAARRDTTFHAELGRASNDVRNDARLQFVVATHAWNLGDLEGCLAALTRLLALYPNHASARLLKIEVLMRLDRSPEVLSELDGDLEGLDWKALRDEFRLAGLLSHFGYTGRAAALAYRLFLKHRDLSRAWMTLSGIVLGVGRSPEHDGRWECKTVDTDAAVDIRYNDGSEQFFVIEEDAELRRLDESSWEPTHKLIRATHGLHSGAKFVGPDGRAGAIAQVRHKYVARLHYVLEHYEQRFPEIFGIKSVPIDVEKPGGLDSVIAEFQSRNDWIAEEEERYTNSPWPIEVFAKRIGVDPIDASVGLASHGRKLKVAQGNAAERTEALNATVQNDKRGCILDLLTYWTAHRLKALPFVVSTCGPVHVTQSVIDRLRERRERLSEASIAGAKTGALIDGKFTIIETPAAQVALLLDDLDLALKWIADNATVHPLIVSDGLPDFFREFLRKDQDGIFHAVALASRSELLLVSDDLATRGIANLAGAKHSAWLHAVLTVASWAKILAFDQFVRWTADLIVAGHNYLGLTGEAIARAAALDFGDSTSPGPLTIALAGVLGGKGADPHSHAEAAAACLTELWTDKTARPYRQLVTSQVLRCITRERVRDSYAILSHIENRCARIPEFVAYLAKWRVGHFFSVEPQRRIEPR